jgi:cytochrome P450
MTALRNSRRPSAETHCDLPAHPFAAPTHADPYPYYRRLAAERPLYRDETLGMWVAASAAAVTAVLTSDICRVRPPAEPVPKALLGSPAADIFRHLVRMNDGESHCPFKLAVVTALDSVDASWLTAVTLGECEQLVRNISPLSRPDRLTRFIFTLPVRAMARLLGVPADRLDDVSRWTHAFATAITPLADASQIAAGKEAARELLALFRGLLAQPNAAGESVLQCLAGEANGAGRDATDVIVANGIGFLSQTYEATAALVGNALLALTHDRELAARVKTTPALVESFVAEVARYHSPTHSTRRFVAQDGVVAGQPMRQGDVILVLLAAASHDGAANARPAAFDIDRPDRRLFTFGAGLHACPGRRVATRIAGIAVGYLLQAGIDLTQLPTAVSYRRSAHLRIPVFGGDLQLNAGA